MGIPHPCSKKHFLGNRKSSIHKRNMFYTIIDPGAQGHQRVSGNEEVWFVTWLLPSDTCLPLKTQCNWLNSMQSIATECSATREVWLEGRHPLPPLLHHPTAARSPTMSIAIRAHCNAMQSATMRHPDFKLQPLIGPLPSSLGLSPLGLQCCNCCNPKATIPDNHA